MMYRDIHNSSAVSSKCSAVFTFTEILKRIKKKSSTEKFISPNNISYSTRFFFLSKKVSSLYEQFTECTSKIIKKEI
jgi:hypothetical protein